MVTWLTVGLYCAQMMIMYRVSEPLNYKDLSCALFILHIALHIPIVILLALSSERDEFTPSTSDVLKL